MSGASSWPSRRGGGPIRRRITRGGQAAGPLDEPVLDLGGSRGGATRGRLPPAVTKLTGTSLGIASLAGRDDGGSDDKRSAAGQPGARATLAAQPAAAEGGRRPRSGRARRVACSTPARTATATCSRSASPTKGTWVMLADPAAIKQVFTGDPKVFHAGEGNQILAPSSASNSVLVLDEKPHMSQRKLLLPPFHGDAHAGLRADDERDRRARDRDLAHRHPVPAAAADAGDDPGDHPADRLRRPRAASGWASCGRRCASSSTSPPIPRFLLPLLLLGPEPGPQVPAFRRRVDRVDELIYREIAERRARRGRRASATTCSRC